jgi:N-acetylglutamate synthase-like GNAT family acetyltransferase|tara:strand:+ start:127 stop:573 length:447 start_codon:yes stop_codon:yes gene_type:complete
MIFYDKSNFEECLSLFDENCPKYFALNERNDYIKYLKSNPKGYKTLFSNKKIIAAYGFNINKALGSGRLSWIIVSPSSKNNGIGTEIMESIKKTSLTNNLSTVDISASHLSAPFFKKFGYIEIKIIENGWGNNMDRVDMKWENTKTLS